MINALDKFSFKEVCDVCFYNIDKVSGEPTSPVLFLDTIKVSTMDIAAKQVDATGGQKNPVLLTWDYERDITVNITDALFSMKTLGVLNNEAVVESDGKLMRQAVRFMGPNIPHTFKGPNGKNYLIPANYTIYDQYFNKISDSSVQPYKWYVMCFSITARQVQGTTISANNFSGVYYMTGETVVRDLKNNTDHFCNFIIPKLKINSKFTIELSGEEPSVFTFDAKALSTRSGQMMSLVLYEMKPMEGYGLTDVDTIHLIDSLDQRLIAKLEGIWI